MAWVPSPALQKEIGDYVYISQAGLERLQAAAVKSLDISLKLQAQLVGQVPRFSGKASWHADPWRWMGEGQGLEPAWQEEMLS